jgi:hypothetical protein
MKAEFLFEVFMPGDMWLTWKSAAAKISDTVAGQYYVVPRDPGGVTFIIPHGPVGAQQWRVCVVIHSDDGAFLGREVLKVTNHNPGDSFHVR